MAQFVYENVSHIAIALMICVVLPQVAKTLGSMTQIGAFLLPKASN